MNHWQPLTELEAAALGDVKRHQPCTAHFIRMQFRASPAARFSDSAGSIYPLMKRLEKRGFVRSQLQRDGERDVRYYSCTVNGLKALREWIGPPFQPDVTLTVDPLRTRVLYLEYLSPHRRSEWLEEAERVLKDKLEDIDRLATANNLDSSELFLRLADENAKLEIRSRLKWIASTRRQLRENGLLVEK